MKTIENKEKNHKGFWKRFSERWLLVNFVSYIAGTLLFWWLFFIGIISLMIAIFLTILNFLFLPLLYYFVIYFRESKHQKIVIKIALVGGGGFCFGGIAWFITGYLLIQAPWAPLRILIGDAVIRGRIFLLLLPTLCGIAAYIMYRIGKKREWRPSSYFIQ